MKTIRVAAAIICDDMEKPSKIAQRSRGRQMAYQKGIV